VPSVRACFATLCWKLGQATSTSTVSGGIVGNTRTVCTCQLLAAEKAARERSISRLGDRNHFTKKKAPIAAESAARTMIHLGMKRAPSLRK
jgi:hypothetical protein